MNFFKSELEMIYQYAAPTRAETLDAMKEALPAVKDDLTRAIIFKRTGQFHSPPACGGNGRSIRPAWT